MRDLLANGLPALLLAALAGCGGRQGYSYLDGSRRVGGDDDGVSYCDEAADCDDGLFCNGTEDCTGGLCAPGTPPSCPPSDELCTMNACDGVGRAGRSRAVPGGGSLGQHDAGQHRRRRRVGRGPGLERPRIRGDLRGRARRRNRDVPGSDRAAGLVGVFGRVASEIPRADAATAVAFNGTQYGVAYTTGPQDGGAVSFQLAGCP